MSKKVVIIGGEGNGGVIASAIEDNRNRYGDFDTQPTPFPVIGRHQYHR